MAHLTPYKAAFPWNAARPDGATSQLFTVSAPLQARLIYLFGDAGQIELIEHSPTARKVNAWFAEQAPGYLFFTMTFLLKEGGWIVTGTSH